MRKCTWLFLATCFIVGIHTTAIACDARFDPRHNLLSIPCLNISGDPNSYAIVLQDTGGNFAMWSGPQVYELENPRVISLRILTTPIPVAVIVAEPNGPCPAAYHRPTFVQAGNNIDIRLKMRTPGEPLRGLVDCVRQPPVAEAVHLVGVSDPMAHTYSVNGVSIAPQFSF